VIRERRRHARVVAKGAVVLRGAETQKIARIENVAEGGASVTTQVTPPERWLGRIVEIEMRLDAGGAEWMRGRARIMRISAGGLALSFVEPPPSIGRVLGELSSSSRARQRRVWVMVIDPDPARLEVMSSAFRSVGCGVIEAGTPLEAVVRLGESSFELDLVAVADSHPGIGSDDLRHFVRENHGGVTLVRIPTEDPGENLQQSIRALVARVLGGRE